MESRKAPTGALAAGSLAGGRPGLAASADWMNAATTRVASNAGRQRDVDEIFKRRHYASIDGILSKIWGGKEMAESACSLRVTASSRYPVAKTLRLSVFARETFYIRLKNASRKAAEAQRIIKTTVNSYIHPP
jgi:hypothetical protein